jgi:hypothetical protein
MTLMRVLTLSLALALGLLAVGCSTDEPGVKNVAGAIEGYVDASPERTAAAAETVVKDLKLVLVSSVATKLDGKVAATTAQGDKVTIDIKRAGDNVSEVSIRVGTLGDEALGLKIFNDIKKQLK